jgi:hypothetical protein
MTQPTDLKPLSWVVEQLHRALHTIDVLGEENTQLAARAKVMQDQRDLRLSQLNDTEVLREIESST